MKAAIICSAADKASENIKCCLLEQAPWKPTSTDDAKWTFGDFQLLEVRGRLIHQDGIDRALAADLLIFASRHQSKTRKEPLLTAHYSGDICSKAQGPAGTLACAAPYALKRILQNLKRFSATEVVMEATHHGPYDILTPSLFIEIGSSEQDWIRKDLGNAVARAILEFGSQSENGQCATAVGFGGGHYAIRHTDVLLSTDICFGHVFATHQIECLNRDKIRQAFDKSRAQFAYFDRKSMGKLKSEIESVVRELGYDVLKAAHIKQRGEIPWEVYLSIRRALRQSGFPADNERIMVTAALLTELRNATFRVHRVDLQSLPLSPSIIREAQRIDRYSFLQMIEIEKIVYLERKDGTISGIFVPSDLDVCVVQKELLEGCIAILNQHYEIEYSRSESKLYIAAHRFSPQLAESLGVSEKPLFAKLARGESIKVDNKVVKPEDVFTRVEKVLDLANECGHDQYPSILADLKRRM